MARTYKATGVDVDKDNALSREAIKLAGRTFTNITEVINGLITLNLKEIKKMPNPSLVISGDGVGTKPKYAFATGSHRGIGQDLVAMCVNDLVRNNIKPLGFLDYIARSKLSESVFKEVLGGMVQACQESDCALLGGETASMSGYYTAGEYELVGFALGFQDRDKIVDGSAIRHKDVIFGLSSSGLHSNGYSLVREIFPPEEAIKDDALIRDLLSPTKIYVKTVLNINEKFKVHGWAHITGTGIIGKLGDIIPDGLKAKLTLGSWPVHEIFQKIQEKGKISDQEMRRTFNLGLGMIGVADPKIANEIISYFTDLGEKTFIIGEIVKADNAEKVTFV